MSQSVMAHLYVQIIPSYSNCYNHFHLFFFVHMQVLHTDTAKHNIQGLELSLRAVCQVALAGLLAQV